jgi:glycosyltransferase involved in cell wall biosynthesis
MAPWVIVAGGFHSSGGMDRANAALASYLLASGIPVHLVGHEIDPELGEHPLATASVVPRPKGMPGVAERLLARRGTRVARRVLVEAPQARVVVNGGNCPWSDVNWVHAVHAAWPVHDAGAPLWSQYRNRRLKASALRRERVALRQARLVVANSEWSRRAVIEHVGIAQDRVRTVYLGSDPVYGPVGQDERSQARAALDLVGPAPVVAFVGALGSDLNKGFDLLWGAWKSLTAAGQWDARLVVAGGGWRLPRWRAEAERAGLSSSVRFVGFTPRVREVLAAADLLVSPVRYEAYGLNVHEALCRGLSVMVSRSAGVVERFDPAMSEALLPSALTAELLADRLRDWRQDVDGWRMRAGSTAMRIRLHSWNDMAAELVAAVHHSSRRLSA